MRVVLLRVGIDKGLGGIYGPLFHDDSFEFICIPDTEGVDERTYGTIVGKWGKPLIEYFPPCRQKKMRDQPVHVDPEFETFTYGDLPPLKSKLADLKQGDLLVFYCGLQRCNCRTEGGLFLAGYFEVQEAVKAKDREKDYLERVFGMNFHVRNKSILEKQRSKLILVKGTENSRLFKKAVRISEVGRDKRKRRIHVLSEEMRERFGDFNGRLCIQRCPPRWVRPEFVSRAADYVKSLE